MRGWPGQARPGRPCTGRFLFRCPLIASVLTVGMTFAAPMAHPERGGAATHPVPSARGFPVGPFVGFSPSLQLYFGAARLSEVTPAGTGPHVAHEVIPDSIAGANAVHQERSAALPGRQGDRPPNLVRRLYAGFHDRTGSWNRSRRVVRCRGVVALSAPYRSERPADRPPPPARARQPAAANRRTVPAPRRYWRSVRCHRG